MRSPSDQKKDADELFTSARKFAAQMLRDFGEFLPYGEIIRPDGEHVSVGATNGEEWPASKDLVSVLKDGYRKEAEAGRLMACVIVYDARVVVPVTFEKKDAIAFQIDHRDGYSVEVFLPYSLDAADVVFDPPFAQKGNQEIFPKNA